MKLIAIDLEYRNTNERDYTLVSCALADNEDNKPKSIWLYKDTPKQNKLKEYLLSKRDTHIMIHLVLMILK